MESAQNERPFTAKVDSTMSSVYEQSSEVSSSSERRRAHARAAATQRALSRVCSLSRKHSESFLRLEHVSCCAAEDDVIMHMPNGCMNFVVLWQ